MTVRQILTHVHPDLDAILSIMLLREHGTEKFSGIREASYAFTSANELPEGKTAEQLEEEGVLTVDTGGGRYDNHPVEGQSNEEKWDICASELVARDLGVAGDERYRFLLPYTADHDVRGQALTSRNATHHLLAPHGLIEGMHLEDRSDEQVVEITLPLFAGIAAASLGEEGDRADSATRFDHSLAAFFEATELPDSPHERGEPMEWAVEGKSHEIARQQGWTRRRDMEKLLKLAADLLAASGDALPDVERERRVQLTSALNGLAKLHGDGSEAYHAAAFPLIGAAIARERAWFDAIDEVERSARVVRGRGVNMVAIASKNGLAIKAARYRRGGNAVLYMDPAKGNVTLQSGQKKDGRPLLNLERIAKRLRAAEIVKRQGQGTKLKENVGVVGRAAGWFLHPSLRLLNRGSPKAPEVEKTVLTWNELIELVTTDLRPDQKMPDWFCPEQSCLEKRCTLFPLRLANCHAHRKRVETTPEKGTLGELFGNELKQLKKKQGGKG